MKTFSLAGILCLLALAVPARAAAPEAHSPAGPARAVTPEASPVAGPIRAASPETSSLAGPAPAEISGMAITYATEQRALAFPSITNERMAKSTPPSGSCTPVPAATTTFSTTDAYAYLYFNISGQANGEQLTRVWYSPDGQVAATGSWNPMASGGGYCPWTGLQIAGSAAASMPGTWRVRVYSNMITDVPYVDLTFTITSGGGGGGGGGFPTITNARTAKSVPQGSCSPVPDAATTFAPTDSYAYLYFTISGHANGEVLSDIWYSPDGQIAARGSWDALPSGGSYCLKSSLQIAGAAAAGKPGTWRVRVYSNMITDVPYVDLTFTITSGGGGGGGGMPTITNARTAKSVPQGSCSPVPDAATTFASTDSYAYLYFTISGHANGEALSDIWYSPDGQIAARGSWDPLTSGGSYCLKSSLQIAGAAAAGKPGTWRVRVYSNMITDVPYVDLTFTITSSGGGGGGGGVAGTWLLTSSARVQGAGAFWQTDLTIRNTGSTSATVTIKFLGHSGDGRGGPEQPATLAGGQTQTWRDVLGGLFGLSSEYGPILIRSTSANLAVLGQTWTSGGGGTYGQSVPVLSTGELIGSTPRSILGVRQDTFFRTNLMLANATESWVDVDVQLVSTSGAVLVTKRRSLGPLSRDQLNVGNDFGYTNLADAVFVISSPTSGAAVGAYASVIDNATQDPRTLLPR